MANGALHTKKKVQALFRPVSIAPLITFRILFGSMMFLSTLRFWYRGWIEKVYIRPSFHFTYTGLEWVQPVSASGMYAVFTIIALSALLLAFGLFYRVAATIFFLGFSYVELIDVTTYLNHYYFISLVAFLLIWVPANAAYSMDVWLWPRLRRASVPAWCIGILRFQMAVVYVFAGIAKLNADWLLQAQPMRIWLPATTHLPIVGSLMYEPWIAYLFSWFGAAYDLFIVFFLLNRRTRPVAYGFVLLFHLATAIFFPGIGLFPYVMMLCSTIFFSAAFHESILPYYSSIGKVLSRVSPPASLFIACALALYVAVQLVVPMRYLLYPGHLFWTEEGYRFSWRVMLMEKSGAAYFKIKDKGHKHTYEVENAAFLTPLQEKMMSTQPDLILKYAHHLAKEYRKRGVADPEVYAEVMVSLNGMRSRLFVDTTVNLAQEPVSLHHYRWILPYQHRSGYR